MSETIPPDSSVPFERFESGVRPQHVFVVQPLRRHYWLHLLLFLGTVFTTLVVGSRLQYNFDHNLAAFQSDDDFFPLEWALKNPREIARGVPFMLTLLGILLAHEMGHFIYAAKNHVYATLPYFLPAPTLIGTLGAFIRIRSPIRSRAALFDIGIAGPIAGFLLAVPLMFLSLLLSKLSSGVPQSQLIFGIPLIFKAGLQVLHSLHLTRAVRLEDLYLHPTAVAVWVGMFATALNLLPGGQLDGGHIIYGVWPRVHRLVSLLTVVVLAPLIWREWLGWFLWAVLLLITGFQHPPVPREPALDTKRYILGFCAVLMFILTFTSQPFHMANTPASLRDIIQSRRSH
jgi:membrane-associated protease RseP (regulator of RpoE activity)